MAACCATPPTRHPEPTSRRGWPAVRCARGSRAAGRTAMTSYWRRALFCAALAPLLAHAQGAVLPRIAAVPGGVITLEIPGGAEQKPVATFNGAPVMLLRRPLGWLAVVGVNLDTEPGELALDVHQPGAEPRRIAFKIGPKQYRTQQLKVPPSQVN